MMQLDLDFEKERGKKMAKKKRGPGRPKGSGKKSAGLPKIISGEVVIHLKTRKKRTKKS